MKRRRLIEYNAPSSRATPGSRVFFSTILTFRAPVSHNALRVHSRCFCLLGKRRWISRISPPFYTKVAPKAAASLAGLMTGPEKCLTKRTHIFSGYLGHVTRVVFIGLRDPIHRLFIIRKNAFFAALRRRAVLHVLWRVFFSGAGAGEKRFFTVRLRRRVLFLRKKRTHAADPASPYYTKGREAYFF